MHQSAKLSDTRSELAYKGVHASQIFLSPAAELCVHSDFVAVMHTVFML